MTLTQYFSLIDTQARMALKADASNYFLGYLWWVLEPLLFVFVFYVVFNIFLSSGRADFLVFLMCGKLPFVWFSKSVTQASNAIIANVGLIGQIDIPKSLFPMVLIQEGLYKQSVVFALLIIVVINFGYPAQWSWLWLLPVMLVNYLLIIGCSFLGAILVCYVRDFSILISLSMVFLMFTSGIFWDVNALADPRMTNLILMYNPVAFILDSYRQVLMYGQPPDYFLLVMVGCGAGMLILLTLQVLRRQSRWLAFKALTT